MMSRPYCTLLAVLLLSGCSHPLSTRVTPPPPAPVIGEPADDDDDPAADSRRAADFSLSRRLAAGDTELRWDAFDRASAEWAAMPRLSSAPRPPSAIAGASPWTPRGPGVVGGRTRAFLVHPKDPNILYAGAVSGGVWKTTDGGQHWTPLTDSPPNLSVGALAFDPADPNIVYLG